ncbi:hypothetical protein [Streptomyces sp. NPDC096105]|uniref:hypothetical protein n=1 Tax=Streptomyces sp. NPDC096105 TaxID=3366074 RepID=UPI0037F959EE
MQGQVRTLDGLTYTLTDTVGFVRRLPNELVDAFRSTLEEVVQADLALHVVDSSSPVATEHIATGRGVLRETGAEQVPESRAVPPSVSPWPGRSPWPPGGRLAVRLVRLRARRSGDGLVRGAGPARRAP